MKKTYSELLADPRWQKKRLEILGRSRFTCDECGDKESTLFVHHRYYISGRMPWEYPDFCFRCLCEQCHAICHDEKLDEHFRKEGAQPVFQDWEVALDYFGDSLGDLIEDNEAGRTSHNFKRPDPTA